MTAPRARILWTSRKVSSLQEVIPNRPDISSLEVKILWPDLPRPCIIGHRGSPVYAPENSLASFEMAAAQGADAIEFDVKLSKDEQVVVIHDPTVDRTTDGVGRISRLPLSTLRTLDAGSWFSPQFRGERIPTLDEVCEAVGRLLYLNIELTNYTSPWDNLVPKVVEIIRKHNIQSRLWFSSFFPHNLIQAHRLLPDTPCSLLTWPGWKGKWEMRLGLHSKEFAAIHPHLSNISDELVKRLHAAGKRIYVWTVNNEEEIKRMAHLEVDGIFTDDVAKAVQILRARS